MMFKIYSEFICDNLKLFNMNSILFELTQDYSMMIRDDMIYAGPKINRLMKNCLLQTWKNP